MNILIVPSWYRTKSNPNLGSFFFEHAKMMKDRGHNVIVANVTLAGMPDYFSGDCYKLKKEKIEGIIEYSYVVPSLGRARKETCGMNLVYKNLKRVYRKIIKDGFQIDLIHAHSYLPAGIAAVKLGHEENIPVIVTEHASDVINKKLNSVQKELLKEVIRSARYFLCVSEALKQSVLEMTDCNEQDVMVIPNTVDSLFKYTPCKKTKYVYITIGNLLPSKRHDLTIKAFKELSSRYDDVYLYIVGDGPQRNNLERMVEEFELESKVTIFGRLSRNSVYDKLLESSCFVLPSDFETFGVVYIEALATGIPVIATRNGGAEEIVEDSNGILVEKDNIMQLAKAMESIMCNYERYDLYSIAQQAKNRFGNEVIGKKLEEVYEDAMRVAK